MRSSKLFFLAGICCILSIAFTGCSTVSETKGSSGTLEPQSLIKFSDVPIPVGLKSLPEQSYCFESSSTRVGVLKYQGKNNPDQIVNFYKEQMPMYNWNLINIVEYGSRILNFDRENETCIITLQPSGWGSTIMTISLGPKSQSLAKKAKTPLK